MSLLVIRSRRRSRPPISWVLVIALLVAFTPGMEHRDDSDLRCLSLRNSGLRGFISGGHQVKHQKGLISVLPDRPGNTGPFQAQQHLAYPPEVLRAGRVRGFVSDGPMPRLGMRRLPLYRRINSPSPDRPRRCRVARAVASGALVLSCSGSFRWTRAATRTVDDGEDLHSPPALVAVLVDRFPIFILFIQLLTVPGRGPCSGAKPRGFVCARHRRGENT
jgi:hypothetical protein